MHQGYATKIHRQQSYGNKVMQIFVGVCIFREHVLKNYTADDYHCLVSLASRFCLSSSTISRGYTSHFTHGQMAFAHGQGRLCV